MRAGCSSNGSSPLRSRCDETLRGARDRALRAVPGGRARRPLQRLTVTSFTLYAPTRPSRELEVPFHLIVSLHVRETVPEIDNIKLPVLVDVELLGDERATQAGPGGTDYRETITVVAHHTGKIALAPATLQAIDARDGKAKQYSTNPLTLQVVGATLRTRRHAGTPALLECSRAACRLRASWAVGIGAIVLLVVLLARRRPPAAPRIASRPRRRRRRARPPCDAPRAAARRAHRAARRPQPPDRRSRSRRRVGVDRRIRRRNASRRAASPRGRATRAWPACCARWNAPPLPTTTTSRRPSTRACEALERYLA